MNPVLFEPPQGYQHIQLKYGPYSASRLIVARCPDRFYSKYVVHDKDFGDSIPAARGSAAHEVLQKITECHLRNEVIGSDQLDSWVQQAIGKYPAAYTEVMLIKQAAVSYVANPSPYRTKEMYCEHELSVAMYRENVEDGVSPDYKFVAVPYYSDKATKSGNKASYFGVILDQVIVDHEIKTITILDHKTTPSTNEKEDFNFQMGCYAFVAALFYPGYTIRTVIHFAHPRLNCYGAPTYWNDEDLQAVEEELRLRIGSVESYQEYPSLPGSGCDYCHKTQACDMFRRLEEQNSKGAINKNIKSVDDAIKFAQHLRVTGVLYDQLNKTLKDWIDTNCKESGIAIDGMWYGFKVGDEKVEWKSTDRRIAEEAKRADLLLSDPNATLTDEQRAMLEIVKSARNLSGLISAHGLKPEDFREWNNDKLKAIWITDRPELINQLRMFVVKEKSTRFAGYKN